MKKDCEIVRDLSLNYLENLLHNTTKEFVDNHLNTCQDCKKYYTDMLETVNEEKNKETNNDDIEINYLKKIRSNRNFLRNTLVLLIIILFLIGFCFIIKINNISSVIDKSYEKVVSMKNSNNYRIKKRTIYKINDEKGSYDVNYVYFYKDGKYKIQYGNDSMRFIEDDSYNKICVYDDLKQIEYYKQDFIEETKGNTINMYWQVINYYKLYNKINYLGLDFQEKRFEGKDCYVITQGNSDCYREIWIEKANMVIVRVVEEEYNKYYCEEIYDFKENIVLDEDVDSIILDSEKYNDYKKININNNATEEIKTYYNILNNNEKY